MDSRRRAWVLRDGVLEPDRKAYRPDALTRRKVTTTAGGPGCGLIHGRSVAHLVMVPDAGEGRHAAHSARLDFLARWFPEEPDRRVPEPQELEPYQRLLMAGIARKE